VTTLLRRSGRGEDALRADQPITRGRWTRAGTDDPRRSRRPWRPVRRTGQAPPAMKLPQRPVRPACASPLPCCIAARATPLGSDQPEGWKVKDDIRTSAVTGPRFRSILA